MSEKPALKKPNKPRSVVPPAKRARKPRPRRDQLTTANAQPEVRDRMPQDFDPFTSTIPLEPERQDAQGAFTYDSFVERRRYARSLPQGTRESRFDAEQYKPSAEYTTRVQNIPLDTYMASDALVQEERERGYVEQPPEAIAQFRDDIRNPKFLAAATKLNLRGTASLAELRRQKELQKRAAADLRALTAAFRPPPVRTAELWDQAESVSVDAILDKDADTTDAVLSGQFESVANAATTDADLDAIDRSLLRQINNELDELEDLEDDEEEAGQRRAELQSERNLIQQMLDERSAARAAAAAIDKSDDNNGDDAAQQTTSGGGVNKLLTNVPMIDVRQAAQLLSVNPLEMLDEKLRAQLMRLPEIALVWQMLQPQVLMHEQHKRHYNLIELVRAMSLCGAKYGGLAQIATEARLSALLDADFYGSFLEYDDDDRPIGLAGGHEHCVPNKAAETRLVVLKFYCVRRDKNNSAVVDNAHRGASDASKATNTQVQNLLDRTDIDAATDSRRQQAGLNRAGLYDAENTVDDVEDDGTDEYGTLHDIRYLDKEFMFCVRLVCVEAVDDTSTHAEASYPSDDEIDTSVLPPELAELYAAENRSEAPGSPSHMSIVGQNSLDFSQMLRLDQTAATLTQRRDASNPTGTSNDAFYSSNTRLSGFDSNNDDPFFEPAPAAALDRAYCHSDDDDEENEREAQQYALLAKEMAFMPDVRHNVDLATANRCVGRWQAAKFIHHVNSQRIAPLCIRAFLFYVAHGPSRAVR